MRSTRSLSDSCEPTMESGAGDGNRTHLLGLEGRYNSRYTTPADLQLTSSWHCPSNPLLCSAYDLLAIDLRRESILHYRCIALSSALNSYTPDAARGLVGQVGLEPTMVKPTDLQSVAIATRRLTHIGGPYQNRTDDLILARDAFSQLN